MNKPKPRVKTESGTQTPNEGAKDEKMDTDDKAPAEDMDID